jgi:hypothetical protein
MKNNNLHKKVTLLVTILVLSLSSCRKSDVRFFDETEEWKVESMVIRTEDLNSGSVISEEIKNYEFFRMKKTNDQIINFSSTPIKYIGNYFELETFVDSNILSESNTGKITFWTGDPTLIAASNGTYEAPHGQVDIGGATSLECFTMPYNSIDNEWSLLNNTEHVMTIRKLKGDRLRVIILEKAGIQKETTIELIKSL